MLLDFKLLILSAFLSPSPLYRFPKTFLVLPNNLPKLFCLLLLRRGKKVELA
jgi:hypothetical protein